MDPKNLMEGGPPRKPTTYALIATGLWFIATGLNSYGWFPAAVWPIATIAVGAVILVAVSLES